MAQCGHQYQENALMTDSSRARNGVSQLRLSLLIGGFTSAVDLSRCFSELAVFHARLYVRVRRLDEPAERCGVCGRSRSQLYMAHELAGALQQAGRIR